MLSNSLYGVAGVVAVECQLAFVLAVDKDYAVRQDCWDTAGAYMVPPVKPVALLVDRKRKDIARRLDSFPPRAHLRAVYSGQDRTAVVVDTVDTRSLDFLAREVDIDKVRVQVAEMDLENRQELICRPAGPVVEQRGAEKVRLGRPGYYMLRFASIILFRE